MFATATSPARLQASGLHRKQHGSVAWPGRQAASALAGRAVASAAAPQGTLHDASDALPLSRRQLLATGTALLAAGASGNGPAGGLAAPPPAQALELAPLGPVQAVGAKLEGLTAEEVKVHGGAGLAGAGQCTMYGGLVARCGSHGAQHPAARMWSGACSCHVSRQLRLAAGQPTDAHAVPSPPWWQDILARNLRDGQYFVTGEDLGCVGSRGGGTARGSVGWPGAGQGPGKRGRPAGLQRCGLFTGQRIHYGGSSQLCLLAGPGAGDLTPEIFADDCVFKDPTNETRGLSRYMKVPPATPATPAWHALLGCRGCAHAHWQGAATRPARQAPPCCPTQGSGRGPPSPPAPHAHTQKNTQHASTPPSTPTQALGILFDASVSAVQLRDIRVTGPRTIEADWLLGGYLKFPWHPRVEAFEGGARAGGGPPPALTGPAAQRLRLRWRSCCGRPWAGRRQHRQSGPPALQAAILAHPALRQPPLPPPCRAHGVPPE